MLKNKKNQETENSKTYFSNPQKSKEKIKQKKGKQQQENK